MANKLIFLGVSMQKGTTSKAVENLKDEELTEYSVPDALVQGFGKNSILVTNPYSPSLKDRVGDYFVRDRYVAVNITFKQYNSEDSKNDVRTNLIDFQTKNRGNKLEGPK